MAIDEHPGRTPLEDLFLLMSWKEQDEYAARKAFAELYQRYVRYLDYICSTFKLHNNSNDNEMRQTIRNNVLVIAYEKAGILLDFKKGSEEKEKDLMFRGWLGTTAWNLFLAILKQHKKEKEREEESNPYNDVEYEDENLRPKLPRFIEYSEIPDVIAEDEPETQFMSAERAQLELALNLLTEKEKDITLTYLNLEDKQGNIPTEIRNNLAQTYKVLPESLRKIKQRTMRKLIDRLNPKRVNV